MLCIGRSWDVQDTCLNNMNIFSKTAVSPYVNIQNVNLVSAMSTVNPTKALIFGVYLVLGLRLVGTGGLIRAWTLDLKLFVFKYLMVLSVSFKLMKITSFV